MFFEHCLDQLSHFTSSHNMRDSSIEVTEENRNASHKAKAQAMEAISKSILISLHVVEFTLTLQEAGCFSVVLECVLAPIAAATTSALQIPTIGIGARPFCSSQVN
ncbi:hypothetical protein LOK49_LG07G00974 [Camellia lanceoleosa]|uniref:Uncharacterized protein n=1 Tax=Camellia lanceoleosa TaxID=1840588 RepID=A0ACC0H5U7_9ERIC|nr:hypothetical protein LOK49_LG07G00974 [Camellia lanceoleosa]